MPFLCLLTGKPREGGSKKRKVETKCLFKTPVLEPRLTWYVLEAQAKSSRYRNHSILGRTIIFSSGLGGYHDFQETGNFFLPSTERLQIFFPPLTVQIIFLKIPQISYNRGGLCRQFFSDTPLGQTIYFSNFSHSDNFFS